MTAKKAVHYNDISEIYPKDNKPFEVVEKPQKKQAYRTDSGRRMGLKNYTAYVLGKVAQTVGNSGLGRRAVNMKKCSGIATVEYDAHNHKRIKKSRCKDLLCPVCSHIRAVSKSKQLLALIDEVVLQHHDAVFLMVTLTAKSVNNGVELRDSVISMGEALKKIIMQCKRKHKKYHYSAMQKIADYYIGHYRAVEITYNELQHSYHPHIHAIIAVHAGIMKDMLTGKELAEAWKHYNAMNYNPIVNVKVIGSNKLVDNVTKISSSQYAYNNWENVVEDIQNVGYYINKRCNVHLEKYNERISQKIITDMLYLLNINFAGYGGMLQGLNKKLAKEQTVEGNELEEIEEYISNENASEEGLPKSTVGYSYKKKYNYRDINAGIRYRKKMRGLRQLWYQQFNPVKTTMYVYNIQQQKYMPLDKDSGS